MQYVEQPIDDNPHVALIFTPDGQVLCLPCHSTAVGLDSEVTMILDERGEALAQFPSSIPYVLLSSPLIEESEEEDTPSASNEAGQGSYL